MFSEHIYRLVYNIIFLALDNLILILIQHFPRACSYDRHDQGLNLWAKQVTSSVIQKNVINYTKHLNYATHIQLEIVRGLKLK